MKNFIRISLVALFTLSIFGTATAQQTADARLTAMFSKKEIATMQQDSPEKVAFWTYYLDHGYDIQEMPKGKGADLPVVSIKDENDFNVLSLGELPQQKGNRYFRIKQSGKLLALHGVIDVEAEMEKK